VKVLKPGEPPKWSMEATCTGAGNPPKPGGGAVLLLEEGDLYRTSHTWMDGMCETYTTFRCPCCGAQTDIQNAPGWVQVRSKEGACL